MKIELTEPMEEFGDEEQVAYIMKFAMPRRPKDIPHLKAKKWKMRQQVVGLFDFVPPPQEHSRKLDLKLGTQFIS